MNQAIATKPSNCANSELEAAKFKLRKFRDETNFSGRKVLLTEATSHLQNVFESGTPTEKRKATRLDATVDLETVKFWVEWPDFGTRPMLLRAAAEERLPNVLKNGTPVEKREATRLDATIDLVTVNSWVKKPDFGIQLSLLIGATKRLQNVLENGTPAEKREATSLDATVDLETVNYWVKEPDFGTRPALRRGATERLRKVLENGTPAEKREATRLKATIESK